MTHEEFEDLLPLGVVGSLTPEESTRLEGHLDSCESCRADFDEYAETASMLALAADAANPPAEIREHVTKRLSQSTTAKVAWREPAAKPATYWPLAAAVTLAVVGAALFVMAAGKRNELDAARKQIAALENQKRSEQQARQELERRLATLTESGSVFELAGQAVAPASSARLFMNREQRSAVVFFHNLPPTGSDESYQLWIIRSDRPDPVSAGVFEVGSDGRATVGIERLPVDTEIKAFAVTLEPRGGVSSPTGSKYLVGG